MQVTRRSPRTGELNTRDIPITDEQMTRWQMGTMIQDAMPNVSAEDREFLMSGFTPEDWATLFPPEDEEG